MAFHALVTSDWHLDGLKKHWPHEHIDRQFHEIDKVYQYAIEQGIEHVIVPGDIADTAHMSHEAYIALLIHLRKYDGHVETHYIPGNHDWSDTTRTSLDLLSLLCQQGFFKSFHLHMDPTQIEIGGVVINMLPHPAKQSLKHKKPCLNFCHVEYNGAIGDNGRKMKVKHEIKTDPRDFTVSGHIHQYQHMKKKRVIYCGNPYQKNFGEKLPKGWIELKAKYAKGDLKVSHRFIANKPDFRFETVLIECQKDFTKLEANPSIRYRLYIDPSVTVPADLRTRIPNIAQTLDSKGKKIEEIAALEDAEAFKQEAVDVPSIDPMFGLKSSFKTAGFTPKDYKLGKSIVENTLSKLGYSSAAL